MNNMVHQMLNHHEYTRFFDTRETIEMRAERLAKDLIRHLLNQDTHLIVRDTISNSLRTNVHKMLNNHSIVFTSLVNKLNLDVTENPYDVFVSVADRLFDHGGITWGKIICLYAFLGRLALWADRNRKYTLKENLPRFVSRYFRHEISLFILRNGGWQQLYNEYPVPQEVAPIVKKILLLAGATLGLLATALNIAFR